MLDETVTNPADRIEQLLADILDLAPSEQENALDDLCRIHTDVADTLRRAYLNVKEIERSVEDRTPGAQIGAQRDRSYPVLIGPYHIREHLGSGGYGTVFLAEQTEPVRRRVAIKVVNPGMATSDVLARFEAEREALNLMNHPSIAKLLDAGETEEGKPYFVMEFVPGLPLKQYCVRHELVLEARLALFVSVCDAVQHAHQKGVIHRDLSANNVLVTEVDGKPMPKIIDFGIAKSMTQRLTDKTVHTLVGQQMGTPEYMSPEQAEGALHEIDTRTDIYALGVQLYELLTDSLPIATERLRSAGPLEMRNIICTESPPTPSKRMSSTRSTGKVHSKSTSIRERSLRGDLDWITMKAMAKERNRRYATAAELSADIDRYLRDEPVSAGPPSASYRLVKFVRRYRVQVTAAATIVLSLIAALITSMVFYEDARTNEKLAEQRLAGYNLLAKDVHLRKLRSSEVYLEPPWPERIDAMASWLSRAEELRSALPGLRATLVQLRARARPSAPKSSPTARGAAWTFASAKDEFLHDTLSRLVRELEVFADPKRGKIAAVRDRLAWARVVETRSIGSRQLAWADARAAIAAADGDSASTLYADWPIDLQPQMGLVPIGKNPRTGLWEFYHLGSAANPDALPHRDADGDILVAVGTGIVFVLVPGAKATTLGAQKIDRDDENFDDSAQLDETPHTESVAPFFLACHEMTQGQWLCLSRGDQPSIFSAGTNRGGKLNSLESPVENFSWVDCDVLLRHHGLIMPHENEWEYACRAGSATPWSTGRAPESLEGHANLLDLGVGEVQALSGGTAAEWVDGYKAHAPVGKFTANQFGFHDMHGNVWEWCQNLYNDSDEPVNRGGAFSLGPMLSRSAFRGTNDADFRSGNLGVRPARAVR